MSHIALRRLCGKVAIVTGSTSGIGYSIAQRLAEEGAKVIVSSRREENVKAAVRNLRSQALDIDGTVCHVSNCDERKKLLEIAQKSGGLDILVCNAAANPVPGRVFDTPESAWDKTFDVNVKSAYLFSKEALPLIKQSKAGRIIYISSIVAFHPTEYLGAYAVSKSALCALTKVAAQQVAQDNITVNCIASGIVKTKFSEVLFPTKEREEYMRSLIPLNRFGEAKEISGVAAFLASDDASYITGENIVVAGGALSRL